MTTATAIALGRSSIQTWTRTVTTRASAGAAAVTLPFRAIRTTLAEFDASDWYYASATVAGAVGWLYSPLPWLAGLWLAGCLFVLARLAR